MLFQTGFGETYFWFSKGEFFKNVTHLRRQIAFFKLCARGVSCWIKNSNVLGCLPTCAGRLRFRWEHKTLCASCIYVSKPCLHLSKVSTLTKDACCLCSYGIDLSINLCMTETRCGVKWFAFQSKNDYLKSVCYICICTQLKHPCRHVVVGLEYASKEERSGRNSLDLSHSKQQHISIFVLFTSLARIASVHQKRAEPDWNGVNLIS